MRSTWYTLFLMISLLAVSCSKDNVIFDEIVDLNPAGWQYDDASAFRFEVDDTTQVYRILLYLEFDTDFQWQNLYTRIETAFPDGSGTEDIVSLDLASKTGEWFGDCSRSECAINIPLQEEVRFQTPGEYTLTFYQHMRTDDLKGIETLGLKVIQLSKDQN